jgi:hypothetical protein
MVLRKKVQFPGLRFDWGGWGVCFVILFCIVCCLDYSGVRGGGKCPEEELTTCSGGPTIIVTSAVYGEREKNYKINYFIIKNKVREIKYCERNVKNIIRNIIDKSDEIPLKMEHITLEFRVF